ncbi:transketolase family protein [Candidatus Saccharibacteria bacterium]|nr:transketolase family protein [Candidatus Saccharibacteria bacterium]
MSIYPLNSIIYTESPDVEPTRSGFGRGLKAAGESNPNIVGLCADLVESVQMHLFANAFPDRYIEVGIAEQNLPVVASGLALAGKIPFAASYAAFSPGRNWEQIKTTVALNQQPVKMIGGHSGTTVGPDGATHQMFEDIALMRVMPNMVVICPGDSVEAEKATQAIAEHPGACYMRLAREKTPVFSTVDSPFEIGKAYVLREGNDVTILATGIETPYALRAAELLANDGINAEIVHVPTVKPLDTETIIASIRKTGRATTCEDAQSAGGFGGAIAELLGDQLPTPLQRIGIPDRYGESGAPLEVHAYFKLDDKGIAEQVKPFVSRVSKYHQGF